MVAETARARALGLDMEAAGRLTADLVPEVLGPQEAALFADPTWGFSAKEAAYKAQFMLTGRMLGFHDVGLTAGQGLVAQAGGLVMPVRQALVAGMIISTVVIAA